MSPREQVHVTPSVQLVTKTARLSRNSQIRLQVNCSTADGPCNGTVKLRTARSGPSAHAADGVVPGARQRAPQPHDHVSAGTDALLRQRNAAMQAFVVGRDARGTRRRSPRA